MSNRALSKELLMGVATAATHIEGGYQEHNWYRWSEQGMIMDGSHCKVACDHINRIESDVELIADLNVDTYRLGLEWSRIEPKEGQFDQEGIGIYIKELKLLQDKNIKPLVTLWHFSNPLWMEDDGAWVSRKSIDRFLNYTQFVLENLHPYVEDWITINEPNVYLTFGYFEGIWPPGEKGNISSYLKAASHFCEAHIRAYHLIHDFYKSKGEACKVGVAHHLRIFDPYNNSPLTKLSIGLIRRLFQDIFLEACTKAEFKFPLKKAKGIKPHMVAEFVGINYYSRDIIRGVLNPATLFGDRSVKAGAAVNDLEWEIYPEGLSRICEEIYQRFGLPIFITENGTCDATDQFRSKYIVDHMNALQNVVDKGIPVERYYHWSLLDNFEWAEGNAARFGLYHNNYETQERTLRASGALYRDICRDRVIKDVK